MHVCTHAHTDTHTHFFIFIFFIIITIIASISYTAVYKHEDRESLQITVCQYDALIIVHLKHVKVTRKQKKKNKKEQINRVTTISMYLVIYIRTHTSSFHILFRLFELNSDKEISLNSFLSCVGQLKFRGTSSLLRLPKPLFGQKEGQQVNRSPSPIHIPPDDNSHSDAVQDNKLSQVSGEEEEVLEKLPYRGRRKALSMEVPEEMEISSSEGTKETITEVKSPKRLKLTTVTQDRARQMEEFSIATHFVKVRRNGLLVDVSTLWDFISTEAVTGSVRNILSHSKPGVQRQGSIFAFDPVSGL